MAWKKNLTQQQKAAYKEQKREEMDELFRRIDEGVKNVFQSDKYREYLRVMSKFTHYSARNCLLIAMQMPTATHVAAYGKWRELGRQVERGQKGIAILAPMIFRNRHSDEQQIPDHPDESEDEEEISGIGFRKIYVWDVSQTSGKPLPSMVHELDGKLDPEQMQAIFRALRQAVGIPIRFEDTHSSAKGYYSPTNNEIVIQSGMSDIQTVKTGIHESAHKLLHDPSLDLETVNASRSDKEVQAESVAFIVAERLGLDTSEYSFPYIAGWSQGKALDKLNKALSEIQQAARTLTDAIDAEMQALEAVQEEDIEEVEQDDTIALGGMAM